MSNMILKETPQEKNWDSRFIYKKLKEYNSNLTELNEKMFCQPDKEILGLKKVFLEKKKKIN